VAGGAIAATGAGKGYRQANPGRLRPGLLPTFDPFVVWAYAPLVVYISAF
jgi:hypothetical protein